MTQTTEEVLETRKQEYADAHVAWAEVLKRFDFECKEFKRNTTEYMCELVEDTARELLTLACEKDEFQAAYMSAYILHYGEVVGFASDWYKLVKELKGG